MNSITINTTRTVVFNATRKVVVPATKTVSIGRPAKSALEHAAIKSLKVGESFEVRLQDKNHRSRMQHFAERNGAKISVLNKPSDRCFAVVTRIN